MTDAPRRFITRSHRIKRAAWVLTVTLAMAAAVSCASYSAGGITAGAESQTTEQPLPALSAAFIRAVDSTDVRIVATSRTAPIAEKSAVAAVLAELPSGSSVTAGDLVTLTNDQHPDGVLAWAIESTGSFAWVSGGPVGIRGKTGAPPRPPRPNFRVDFVDATTGAWLEGVEGYSSADHNG
jgi:hypothetical protein